MSGLLSTLVGGPNSTEGSSQAPALSVEGMFSQIMAAVQKSNSELAELRDQYHDLKQANANLERQLREQLTLNANGGITPGGTRPPSPRPGMGRSGSLFAPREPPSMWVPSPMVRGDKTLHQDRELPGFWVVVPAGGVGSRLWPLSRETHPKFLLDLTQSGRSLLQATWDRLLPLCSPNRLMVVTGQVHGEPVSQQLPDMLPNNLLCEPSPKDSAAAIGLSAVVLARRDPEAIMGSFAADHMISGEDAFLTAVTEAVATARNDFLVTIGIAPSHPATGFGYIKLGELLKLKDAPNARKVLQFKEKPDARTASAYLATGAYSWNAGMFVVKAQMLVDLLKENAPELHAGLEKIAEVWDDEKKREQAFADVWPSLPKIAIDNAVAEPAAAAGKVAVVKATFGWDDVGDFGSLSDLLPAERNQARILGDPNLVLLEQVAGGIVVPAAGRLVACLGVDDLVIVDTPDALLVTTRARSQEVKRIVKLLGANGLKTLL
ncbi:mannose-1-phosphate guanylyltransferase [Clavulina sp. PMI_390]|nr:mannose-1-phosphate guanylyltransferase [Clavulina sp. PMI_390]